VAKRPGEINATQISRKLEIYSATTGKNPMYCYLGMNPHRKTLV